MNYGQVEIDINFISWDVPDSAGWDLAFSLEFIFNSSLYLSHSFQAASRSQATRLDRESL